MRRDVAILALSALALDTRLRAIQLLADAGDEGLPAGEIARLLDVPQPTVSEHLKILAHAGVVSSERRSRSIIYRANTKLLVDLIDFLSGSIGMSVEERSTAKA
jgi:DNA-binding transcriptional ArsR family regulator